MLVRRSLRALAAVAVVTPTLAAAPLVHTHDRLTDLQLGTESVTDGAKGSVTAWQNGDGTTVILRLRGLDRAHAGHTYGAHVHVGHCVEGKGSEALAHYNATGGPPSPETEVWLDVTVGRGGTAYARADVPFTIGHGDAHSVVVHEHATHPDTGAAGGRIACLPVHF